MKIYLAGPMRGLPYFNYPAFHKAAKLLRDQGYYVFNPAENDGLLEGGECDKLSPTGDLDEATEKGFDIRAALGADLAFICEEADGIAMLPGWEFSKGARAEYATAVALGLRLMFIHHDDTIADVMAPQADYDGPTPKPMRFK